MTQCNFKTLDIWIRTVSNKAIDCGLMAGDLFDEGRWQVCSLLSMSCPQSVYAWYNGRTMPSLDNLYGLSRLFQCSIDDLVLSVEETFNAI